ncbi:hypothetical protein HNP40_000338 [Mycobacteroides chelonae]|nr:hypothetical protein [Mycobacteroides chelonae]
MQSRQARRFRILGTGHSLAPVCGARMYNLAEDVRVPIHDLELTLVTCLVWPTNLAEQNEELHADIEAAVALLRNPGNPQRADTG